VLVTLASDWIFDEFVDLMETIVVRPIPNDRDTVLVVVTHLKCVFVSGLYHGTIQFLC
jgi:predicted Zn-dependent protease with MMP-like domain